MLRALQRYGAYCVAATLAAAILYVAPASSQEKANAASQEKAPAAAKPRQLSLPAELWTGDFDQMLERRIIRVLAPYSRTLFYHDKGH